MTKILEAYAVLQQQIPLDLLSKNQGDSSQDAAESAMTATAATDTTSVISSLPPQVGYILIGVAIGIVAGAVLGWAFHNFIIIRGNKKNKARWPRDWPKIKDIISNNPDPTKPGYMGFSPEEAMGSGAMPLGRTYPRFSIFPDVYPFREWRRRAEYFFSKPVWVQYQKRFQHFSVLGATGKGKSTSFAVPILAYGALEKNSAYFAIDVKSPAFLKMFALLYRRAGKPVYFFDPWSLDETLAFEPLWRASDEQKDILADVIATYSAEAKEMSSSENSDFFKVAATRLMRGILELAQFWPRRYCNLPCAQKLISSGGEALKEAFEKSPALFPDVDEILAAAEAVLEATDEELRDRENRSEVLEGALAVLDRSGYRIAFIIKRMRAYNKAHEAEKIDQKRIGDIRSVFWAQLKAEWQSNKERLDAMLMQQGEFINQPEDTRNSIVSTLTNKVDWFKEPHIAKSFSRDELDIRALITEPCLFLIGAPMAKLKVGSLFIASIISNFSINAVFQRGMAIERRAKGVSKHGIFFMLDEFPQLQIKSAPSILATFRGFVSGVIMILQERGQLRQLYSDDITTMEGNTVHKVLLQGAHEETAEFYADKTIGQVQITKRSKSGAKGEKKSISENIESVPLMSGSDVKAMRLNDKVKPMLALSVGADTPPFPLRPIPFYEDPTLRRLLKLERDLKKKDPSGNPTKKFWKWQERWEQTEEAGQYMQRRPPLPPSEREAGKKDPVWERRQDPYTQYLDYLVGRPKGAFDQLVEPRLVLQDIAVTQNAPGGPSGGGANPFAGGGPGGGKSKPSGPPPTLVPVYGADFRILISEDFNEPESIPAFEPIVGSIEERVELYEEVMEDLEDELEEDDDLLEDDEDFLLDEDMEEDEELEMV